ncbi:glucose-1-phosphate cytidylyltransferase [Nocardioides stalactiti]|uniref:glucose-1-phosphate cytidylyltransferase n=1 Tax=Nocardioides stalactiti TaxID=2755356 RepID=UPI0028A7B454|nr:glucose-1-phosphate cytidylyltransferase [Nocardioides stalactiti]
MILAGGLGTRIAEETQAKPKPMVMIGGRPMIWHILKLYSHHGINDFIICCGYKGYVIKEYFANYALHMSNVTFHMATGQMTVHEQRAEPWTVTLVDTGDATMTGGRLRRVQDHLPDDEPFAFTYGDGLTDADISDEIAFHRAHGKQATVMAVEPPARFGALLTAGDAVTGFTEKPAGDGASINGGFFVLEKSVIDLIDGDASVWEREPMEKLAAAGELMAYRHRGFWQPMDTLREKSLLESLWSSGEAPWKKWD